VLSGADFLAQEMAKFLGWHLPGIRPDILARGRIIPPCEALEKWLRTSSASPRYGAGYSSQGVDHPLEEFRNSAKD
jgi:hypothetical protein